MLYKLTHLASCNNANELSLLFVLKPITQCSGLCGSENGLWKNVLMISILLHVDCDMNILRKLKSTA